MSAHTTGIRINGEALQATGPEHELASPITGETISTITLGTEEDTAKAYDYAQSTFDAWSTISKGVRAQALREIAVSLRNEAEKTDQGSWAWLISTETGKRLAEAQAELNFSAVYFETFADLIIEQETSNYTAIPGITHQVEAHPIGVSAVLTPWNFPISIPARKIAAALAAGCTVVFKPAEIGVLSSLRLSALIDEHVAPGVVNTVLATPEAITSTWFKRVDSVSFTGSTRVGRIVAKELAPRFIPQVLELGGNASFVVLDDADVSDAVDTLLIGKFRNNGQSCIAANTILLPKNLASDFTDLLRERTENLIIGDPRTPETDLGPLAPAKDPSRIQKIVADAVESGGTPLIKQMDMPGHGYYSAPQFVINPDPASEIVTSEIFGPVAGILLYDDINEALKIQHSSGYGLASYVVGTDSERAATLAASFRAGIVGVNNATPNYPGAPFGGLGDSGLGYEGGRHGLEAHQYFQTIATRVYG